MKILDQTYETINKVVDRTLRWCSEKMPREWQDKVMTAYVGRALSLDIPQLYRNIRYGMRDDPILARQEYHKLLENWDQVEAERDKQDARIRREQIPVVHEQSSEAVDRYKGMFDEMIRKSKFDALVHGDYKDTNYFNMNFSRGPLKGLEPLEDI
ncbi:hypothetical protein KY343_04155 [Candidatus Woesearchaeota archaeon]|nr:hypothetical protein [Candidatus Woesearchaeota archaeon]